MFFEFSIISDTIIFPPCWRWWKMVWWHWLFQVLHSKYLQKFVNSQSFADYIAGLRYFISSWTVYIRRDCRHLWWHTNVLEMYNDVIKVFKKLECLCIVTVSLRREIFYDENSWLPHWPNIFVLKFIHWPFQPLKTFDIMAI